MPDLNRYKLILLEMRQTFSARHAALDRDLHHVEQSVEKDFAEQATQRENDDVLNSLDSEARDKIMLIDKALLRIKNGEYGLCEVCGEAIDEQRLNAIPYASRCIDCAE